MSKKQLTPNMQPSTSQHKKSSPHHPTSHMDPSVANSINMPGHNRPSKIPQDLLDDLCGRFIINLPREERENPVRLIWQIELAHWFYIDEYCSKKPTLPQIKIKEFAEIVFKHIPGLGRGHVFDDIYKEWQKYKSTVPTYGVIVLDKELKHVLLVQGFWNNANWGFPKGKVNADEQPVACAIREAKEEIGFDCSSLVREDMWIEQTIGLNLVRLYIIQGVDLSTNFAPETKNEIRHIQWFALDDLPAHREDVQSQIRLQRPCRDFFMAIPFIPKLREWAHVERDKMLKKKRREERSQRRKQQSSQVPAIPVEQQKEGAKPKEASRRSHNRILSSDKYSSPLLRNITIDFKSIWRTSLEELKRSDARRVADGKSPKMDPFFVELMQEAICDL